MYPHQIRLAAPWERLELPTGRMQYRRRFGRPRQLDEWERVWILAPGCVQDQVWRLNDSELGWRFRGDGVARAAATDLLRDRNELVVDCEAANNFGGAILEIGCRAWIQDVQARPGQDGMRVAIEVQSESADDPLELYVSIGGENRGYRGPFQAAGAVREQFHIDGENPRPGTQLGLGVDLICRSTLWDRREIEINCG